MQSWCTPVAAGVGASVGCTLVAVGVGACVVVCGGSVVGLLVQRAGSVVGNPGKQARIVHAPIWPTPVQPHVLQPSNQPVQPIGHTSY